MFEGKDLTNISEKELALREKMGMVFQSFNLFPNILCSKHQSCKLMRVKELLKDEAEKKAKQLLEKRGRLV